MEVTEMLTVEEFMVELRKKTAEVKYWPWSCPDAVRTYLRGEAYRLLAWVGPESKNEALRQAKLFIWGPVRGRGDGVV